MQGVGGRDPCSGTPCRGPRRGQGDTGQPREQAGTAEAAPTGGRGTGTDRGTRGHDGQGHAGPLAALRGLGTLPGFQTGVGPPEPPPAPQCVTPCPVGDNLPGHAPRDPHPNKRRQTRPVRGRCHRRCHRAGGGVSEVAMALGTPRWHSGEGRAVPAVTAGGAAPGSCDSGEGPLSPPSRWAGSQPCFRAATSSESPAPGPARRQK